MNKSYNATVNGGQNLTPKSKAGTPQHYPHKVCLKCAYYYGTTQFSDDKCCNWHLVNDRLKDIPRTDDYCAYFVPSGEKPLTKKKNISFGEEQKRAARELIKKEHAKERAEHEIEKLANKSGRDQLYYDTHREDRLTYRREYYAAHREEINAKARAKRKEARA